MSAEELKKCVETEPSSDGPAPGGGYVSQVQKKETFIVRNTFIEQIPGTPSSPLDRQVQSCPGTSVLHHATPDDRHSRALQAVPSSPGSEASERLGTREKPWSEDLVASLVNAAATAVEMHTPSLPGASCRSSPMIPQAAPLESTLRDPVADAVNAAAPEEESLCNVTTPSPWQSATNRQEFCATPSPWQGSAVINPELTAKLLAMGQKTSDGRVEDPVAMIVASAAAAANREPPPPPQAPPPAQYCGVASPQVAPPLRLPRIESGIARIDEGDNSALHSASSEHEIPDAQAMAESFAALVKQNSLMGEAQWWQPIEEAVSTEDEEKLKDFVSRWGLDQNCERILRNLPQHVRQEVLAHFLASPETRNVSAKFMSWLSSRMRNFEEIQSALVTTAEERLAFYNRWRLDQKCRQLVEEQAPSVQRELISNFNPPAGTKNVAGRMTAFLNMILNKTRTRQSGPQASSPSKRENRPPGAGYYSNIPADQDLARRIEHFVAQWNLDHGAKSALLALPQDAQQAAMDGFSPSSQTECTSRRFVAYLRSARSYIVNRNGKGKSSGKGRSKVAEKPAPVGLMAMPQAVPQAVPQAMQAHSHGQMDMWPKLSVN
ncbi:Uncharacterized protein SCF082_LOCUS1819 [Durusdinium trenchii]|uniref:Uncharacterized protein n=1 Tax=Durusdinium trenchii TaxID=1381693 RepID=A0ABP0HHZ7_9DINO